MSHTPATSVSGDRPTGAAVHPQGVREKCGEKYHIVTYEDRIELIPVAEDPLAAVREAAGDLRDASVEEIRDDVEAVAKADAGEADTGR